MARILGDKHYIFKHIEEALSEFNVNYIRDMDADDMFLTPLTKFCSNIYVHIRDIEGEKYVFRILNENEENTYIKFASIYGTMEMGYVFVKDGESFVLKIDGADMELKINDIVVANAYVEIKN